MKPIAGWLGRNVVFVGVMITAGAAQADLPQARSLYEAQRWDLAVPLMREQADAGQAQAAFWLGVMLLEGGHGIKADPVQGRDWLQRAAETGHAGAQYELYVYYSTTAPDLPQRLRWGQAIAHAGAAAASGSVQQAQAAMAAFDLGRIAALRQPADLPQAAYWWSIAGRLGNAAAGEQALEILQGLPAEQQVKISRDIAAWQPNR